MDFGLSDEQLQIKESARVFLAKECDTKKLRQFIAEDEGFPHDLYRAISELGWPGLAVPERFGGAGLGMLEMSLVLEECGYAGLPGPYLFSSAIAAAALVAGDSDDLNERWLK
jgi:alkylation response protein AidB-like acyl-CoA dehydrogenase